MIKEEVKNMLEILLNVKKAIAQGDVSVLRDLSNRTIHSASTEQNPDSISLAVITYSLSKIMERGEYQSLPGWKKFYSNIQLRIDQAIDALKKEDEEILLKSLKEIQGSISNLSGDLRNIIKDIFRKAQINKASKIYEHGISMEKTAQLLGISIWELAAYSGQKNASMQEQEYTQTEDVKKRIKVAMEMFI